jgi:type IV pilus assembly protein PilE
MKTYSDKKVQGFTLIELMISVAVIGILSTIAIANYSDYVVRASRADARATLVRAAQYMERIRTESGSYKPGGVLPTLGTGLNQSPDQGTAKYTIGIAATSTAQAFTVTATPQGATATVDVCGNISIDNTGLKTFDGTSGTTKICWDQ